MCLHAIHTLLHYAVSNEWVQFQPLLEHPPLIDTLIIESGRLTGLCIRGRAPYKRIRPRKQADYRIPFAYLQTPIESLHDTSLVDSVCLQESKQKNDESPCLHRGRVQ